MALVSTHPLWRHLTTAVPSDIGDPLLNAWILAWDGHALLTDPAHLFDANIFFPLKDTLAYSEHLLGTALPMLPILLISGEPVLAYNVAFLTSFMLSGFGLYLLVLRYTGNRLAAFLAGLAFALAGGCPGRQLFLAGEGDGDASVFVLGMIVGAAFAHNFGLASSPNGVGTHGIAAVIIGLLICLFIGFTMRKRT